MDPINEAYQLDEKNFNQYSEFEVLVYNILKKHDLGELATLGKVLGGRIDAAIKDALPVAPTGVVSKFKKSVTTGMK